MLSWVEHDPVRRFFCLPKAPVTLSRFQHRLRKDCPTNKKKIVANRHSTTIVFNMTKTAVDLRSFTNDQNSSRYIKIPLRICPWFTAIHHDYNNRGLRQCYLGFKPRSQRRFSTTNRGRVSRVVNPEYLPTIRSPARLHTVFIRWSYE